MPLQVSLAPPNSQPSDADATLAVYLAATDAPPPPDLGDAAATETARLLGMDVLGENNAVHLLGGSPPRALVGVGAQGEVSLERLRRAAAHAVAAATDLRRKRLVVTVPATLPRDATIATVVDALAEGAALAAQARAPRASVTPKPDALRPPDSCLLRVPEPHDGYDLAGQLRRTMRRVAAVELARELADTPANLMPPLALAERAAGAAEAAGLSAEVLRSDDLERLGMGLLLAVGGGSHRPPALAVLRYRPPAATGHVAIVGKGITFDAGGINLKPAKGMADMVHDKAGAAVAAAVAIGAAELRLDVAVTALLACAENLPSGTAYRPGDVLTGLDGSTVEVVDTDAEGRLVLADALTYATRLDDPPVDTLLDVATLTGSIVAALGQEAAGLFGGDDELAERMLAAARTAGEPLWRMPILPGHRAQLKSDRADRKQCADRWGDCAIAAAFLEAYTAERPWLHLDVAGVSYNEGSPEWPPYHPKSGAAGTGVRTLLRFLEGEAGRRATP